MKENSIEEAKIIIEKLISAMKSNRETLLKKTDKEIYTFFINALEFILSDYKRVLKENEILKEEKAQAWEEWNNLEQGSYETEQKLKQQIKKLQKENEELKNQEATARKINELLVQRYSNSIPIQKIKDIQKEKEWALESYYCDEADYKQSQAIGAWSVLQELIEESEEK